MFEKVDIIGGRNRGDLVRVTICVKIRLSCSDNSYIPKIDSQYRKDTLYGILKGGLVIFPVDMELVQEE